MQTTHEESRRWLEAADFLSDLGSEDGEIDRAVELLYLENRESGAAARELRQQWRLASRDEVEPIRGFNFWFPRRIHEYQILRPLSQTFEETVCLARHLPSGRILGMKLLAPGSGGEPSQLRDGVESALASGVDQGVAFLAFSFTNKPVIASTRELILAAKEDPRAYEIVPAARPAVTSKSTAIASGESTQTNRGNWFQRILPAAGRRLRGIWKRPAMPRASFGVLAIGAGALLVVQPGISRTENAAQTPNSMRTMNPEANCVLGRRMPSLEELNAQLALHPDDTESLALRALALGKQKSPQAWKDFDALARTAPDAFGASLVESYLEDSLGAKPRQIPSLKENPVETPRSLLDYAILGITSATPPARPANAGFSAR